MAPEGGELISLEDIADVAHASVDATTLRYIWAALIELIRLVMTTF